MIGSGVTLVTGLPGSGKTALVVKLLSQIADRPLFVMGIPDLMIEHNACPPVDQWVELRNDPNDESLKLPYFTFPPNAIVVLDEAQRVYRPRQVGSAVPDIVAAFETRRHTGVDFVLITQHPSFVDVAIRRLTARHIHIHVTPLGRYKLEWQGVGDIESNSSRELAVREKYAPPKEVFKLYKSAELHTKPVVRRPWLVYAFVPMLLGLVAAGLYVKHRMDSTMAGDAVKNVARTSSGVLEGPGQGRPEKTALSTSEPLNKDQYIAQFQPRVTGFMHSAPVYDELTKPQQVPEPVGCVESQRTGCKCYTQQGTPYDTTESICRQIMASGMWMPWRPVEERRQERASAAPSRPAAEPFAPDVGHLPQYEPTKLTPTPKA